MVERLYPGVYLAELPSSAKPIEGVSTAPPHADPAHASLPSPEWSDHPQSDPGVTLVQLFAWLGESLLFRTHLGPTEAALRAPVGSGIAQGLAVDAGMTDTTPGLVIAPGTAVNPAGQAIEPDPHSARHRVRKP